MSFPIIDVALKLFDKILPDPQAKAEAKIKLLELQQSGELAKLTESGQNVRAEAQGNWLQKSWRPLTMLTFTALIVARWLGWAAPNLSEAEYLALWDIVEFGLGGYVVGRSVEKIAPDIAKAMKK